MGDGPSEIHVTATIECTVAIHAHQYEAKTVKHVPWRQVEWKAHRTWFPRDLEEEAAAMQVSMFHLGTPRTKEHFVDVIHPRKQRFEWYLANIIV